tara:strand:+ start:3043 stop:3984 length:942 start_codon:yes stop_codon:yes gene_type:complete
MCVIMKFTDSLPKKEMLEQAEDMNKDGGGIAWIEDGHVRWEKGMHVTSVFIMDIIKKEKIQLPIIVHFRIATHGAIDTPLCHPFAISGKIDETLSSGRDPEGVLFHNGIWRDYKEVALKLLMNRQKAKLFDGDVSDSRVMAWLVRYMGMNYLSMIDEKVCVLTPKGIQTFGKGWTTVDKIDCSNSNFEKKQSYTTSYPNYYGGGHYNSSFQDNYRSKQIDQLEQKMNALSKLDKNVGKQKEKESKKLNKIDEVEKEIMERTINKHKKSKATLDDYEDTYSKMPLIPEDALENYNTWQEWCLMQELERQGDHNN